MSLIDPALARLVDRIKAATADRQPLDIRGGGTKAFYGGEPVGDGLDVRVLRGISKYEPSELVVTVRAGTPLAELEAALAEQGQCLPFEPPRFAAGGTVGGMVAAGLAGPARASVGGVRDYVLGATMVNGRGEIMSFGGQVMKNVAGYDLSRVLAGSLGVLGLIAEVSLKVLPLPRAVATVRREFDAASAIKHVNDWSAQPLPLNASAWWDGMLVLRLAGAEAAVKSAVQRLGGEVVEPAMADPFWLGLRDHSDEFFVGAAKAVTAGAGLWRLSVPSWAPPLKLSGEQLVEWGGAQRWICTSAPAATLREAAAAVGGHAQLFRAREKPAGALSPLPAALERIHRGLKQAFDPAGIFNPGRLFPGL
jgi:glycolate oxidase FAD binding subunit